jgi:hypothetical protein
LPCCGGGAFRLTFEGSIWVEVRHGYLCGLKASAEEVPEKEKGDTLMAVPFQRKILASALSF